MKQDNDFKEMQEKLLYLTKENERLQKILFHFGYPENQPSLKANPDYWKKKYKDLMEEKISIERQYTKLFDSTEKLIRNLQSQDIKFNDRDFLGIKNFAGINILPGRENHRSGLNYQPFNNKF